jgi:hypothetical protein
MASPLVAELDPPMSYVRTRPSLMTAVALKLRPFLLLEPSSIIFAARMWRWDHLFWPAYLGGEP